MNFQYGPGAEGVVGPPAPFYPTPMQQPMQQPIQQQQPMQQQPMMGAQQPYEPYVQAQPQPYIQQQPQQLPPQQQQMYNSSTLYGDMRSQPMSTGTYTSNNPTMTSADDKRGGIRGKLHSLMHADHGQTGYSGTKKSKASTYRGGSHPYSTIGGIIGADSSYCNSDSSSSCCDSGSSSCDSGSSSGGCDGGSSGGCDGGGGC